MTDPDTATAGIEVKASTLTPTGAEIRLVYDPEARCHRTQVVSDDACITVSTHPPSGLAVPQTYNQLVEAFRDGDGDLPVDSENQQEDAQ